MVYDVLVLGGGITGAGILRDCALRGLKAALIEKGEPGRGTTANCTHLVHGGLRYLLYDRLTTHFTSWDSGNIARIAGPILQRLPLLWPVYSWHRHGLETVHALLKAYRPFQKMKYGLDPLRLSREETLRLAPGLASEKLRGGLIFDEWLVDPILLVRQNLDSAIKAGAEAWIQSEVEEFLIKGKTLAGVRLKDKAGVEKEIAARLTVNASGPWANLLARRLGISIPLRLRKGTHLVYEGLSAGRSTLSPLGLVLEAADRKRYIFIVPLNGKTLVGPTDTDCLETPDHLSPTPEEIRYLVQSASKYIRLPEEFQGTLCGARPILGQTGDERLLSREHEIFDHETRDGLKGFLSIAGGKLSSYRMMAEELTDLICLKLERQAPCATHLKTLWGEEVRSVPRTRLPSPALRKILTGHTRLRELHALACLGGSFATHLISRLASRRVRSFNPEEYYGKAGSPKYL